MKQLDDLKNSAKTLELAIRMTDSAGPNPQQIETIINRVCEAFADAVRLVKAIWKE